LASNIRKT